MNSCYTHLDCYILNIVPDYTRRLLHDRVNGHIDLGLGGFDHIALDHKMNRIGLVLDDFDHKTIHDHIDLGRIDHKMNLDLNDFDHIDLDHKMNLDRIDLGQIDHK